MAGKEIKWSAPEFEYIPKGAGWYWLTAIISIILIAISVWQKNFLFAVFILIAEILVLVWGSHYPRDVEFKLDQNGLAIGEQKFYPYQELQGFAVKVGPEEVGLSEILITKKSKISPHVKIFIPNDDLQEVREFLNEHLHELEYEESLIDHLSKLLRF